MNHRILPSTRRPGTRPSASGPAALGLVIALVFALLAGCGSSGDTGASGDTPDSPAPSSSAPSSAPSSPGATSQPSTQPSTQPEQEPSGAGQGEVTITIADFAYSDPGDVAPGQTVTLVNEDDVAHTVTARKGDQVFDVNVPPGGTARLTAPDRPGSYAYYCTFHTNMTGTLTVA